MSGSSKKKSNSKKKKIKQQQSGLTSKEEEELIENLNDFGKWLIEKKIVKNLSHIHHTVEMPFANEDWVMKVDSDTVSFNTFVSEKCSFGYYKAIVLHEFFHLAVQKVPNKEDAVRVKDDFGKELMNLIDIEADFFTTLFYKEKLSFTLVDYLSLYYEGSTVFQDKRIRAIKFERFIGAILSITKLYLSHPKKKEKNLAYDLYLPSIGPIYTEDSLHILVVTKEHIYFDEIHASYNDFADIKRCYLNATGMTKKNYVKTLIEFACKAFNIPMPENIQVEIDNIK